MASVALLTALTALAAAPAAQASHGDIHASCRGNTPVVKSRPPGTEHIAVTCEKGLVQFVVTPRIAPAYNPLSQKVPTTTPPDFGGWVTVWRNASESPLIWYNVGTGSSEGCWA